MCEVVGTLLDGCCECAVEDTGHYWMVVVSVQ